MFKYSNLKIIAYSSESKEKSNSWDVWFNEKDFGWNGTIHNVELQSFLDTDFDVLISYYEEAVEQGISLNTSGSNGRKN